MHWIDIVINNAKSKVFQPTRNPWKNWNESFLVFQRNKSLYRFSHAQGISWGSQNGRGLHRKYPSTYIPLRKESCLTNEYIIQFPFHPPIRFVHWQLKNSNSKGLIPDWSETRITWMLQLEMWNKYYWSLVNDGINSLTDWLTSNFGWKWNRATHQIKMRTDWDHEQITNLNADHRHYNNAMTIVVKIPK